MVTNSVDYKGMHIVSARGGDGKRVAYILAPLDRLEVWLEQAVAYYDTSVVVISGMDWNNDLTPWPAPGEPPGSPAFKGDADNFLKLLQSELIPFIEADLQLAPDVERTLVGISLSGLFSLWQWMQCDTFKSIASLSGSFWYDNFVKWLSSQSIPAKSGKAFFLLGDQEANTKVKAFQSVAKDTAAVVQCLTSAGIDTHFEWVPGDHYSDGIKRLDRAMKWLYGAH